MITSLAFVAFIIGLPAAAALVTWRRVRRQLRDGDDLMAVADATREPRPAPFDVDAWEEAWERQQRGDRL